MEDAFKNVVIAFLLFGLFSVMMVTLITGLAGNYGVSNEKLQEATSGALDVSDVESDLGGVDTSAENFRARFESGEVDDVDDPSGLFSVGGDIIGVVTSPFNLLARVGQNILGIPEIVIKVMLAIISITLILALWSLLRSGR